MDPDGDQLIFSWAATGGSISGSSSTVTWTAPSTTWTYTVTCTVSDNKGGIDSKGVNIAVTESITPLSITTTSLPSGTAGVLYGTNLSATGGRTPYTWSVISGSLPIGLSMSTSGLISGTSPTTGTYNFTVKVIDGSSPQQTDSKALSITVNPSTSGVLSVSPSDGLVSSGPQGGPFSPSSKTYTLSNTGGASINWTASKGQNWVYISATSGSLTPGQSITIAVQINSNANNLSQGNYSDVVNFTNITNGNGNQTRTVNLTVSGLPTNPPTVTTGTYQIVSSSSAQLFGTVNPNGLTTTGWFQWGTTTSYGNATTAESLGSGTSVVQMLHTISGLSPNTTYHFRAVAQNSAGINYGLDMSFTMPSPTVNPPTVTTDAATSIASSSAYLNMTVNPNGSPTTAWFEWGTTTSYGNITSYVLNGYSGTSPVSGPYPLSGLSPNTTYHFRAVAQNSTGTSYGNDRTFTTSPGAPTLSFTGLTPSIISTSTAGYQATLSATGSNFNNVNQVTFTWVGATSGSVAWFRGDTNWNSKVTVNSDTSMTLRPVVTASGDPAGTTTWYVTLTDTTGVTASRSFTVTYTP